MSLMRRKGHLSLVLSTPRDEIDAEARAAFARMLAEIRDELGGPSPPDPAWADKLNALERRVDELEAALARRADAPDIVPVDPELPPPLRSHDEWRALSPEERARRLAAFEEALATAAADPNEPDWDVDQIEPVRFRELNLDPDETP